MLCLHVSSDITPLHKDISRNPVRSYHSNQIPCLILSLGNAMYDEQYVCICSTITVKQAPGGSLLCLLLYPSNLTLSVISRCEMQHILEGEELLGTFLRLISCYCQIERCGGRISGTGIAAVLICPPPPGSLGKLWLALHSFLDILFLESLSLENEFQLEDRSQTYLR
jgi:hypothetical protein